MESGGAMENNYHVLTYRPGDGTVQVVRISGKRDLADVLGEIQDRLFDRSPLERAQQAAHADAILRRRNGN